MSRTTARRLGSRRLGMRHPNVGSANRSFAFRAQRNARRNHSLGAPSPPMQAPASSKSRSVGPSGQDILYAGHAPERYVVINDFQGSQPNRLKFSTARPHSGSRQTLKPVAAEARPVISDRGQVAAQADRPRAEGGPAARAPGLAQNLRARSARPGTRR
jgi:hypothetical protein